MLGPDEYLVIYKLTLRWPAFYRTCRTLYNWAREYRRREIHDGVKNMSFRRSTFMLSKFSDHVHDWDSYCKAMLITPPIHENRDLMSIALIKRLVKERSETCVRVLEDMRYGIGMWVSQSGLYFEAHNQRPDVQYWMFAAYEACMAGNANAVHGCMDVAYREGYDNTMVVKKSLEFLATVWNAHNDVKMPLTKIPGLRLGFNDCIYNCVLHNDHLSIQAVIKTYEINLLEQEYYSRDKIKQRVKMPGYELCRNVLDENEFF